jgi:thiol-disulfide isomerase/thioredoxin
MAALVALKVPYMLATIITVSVVMVLYMKLITNKSRLRYKVLAQECNPVEFIKITEQQLVDHKKNKKAVAYLTIDKAAALIAQGDFEQAKELLLAIDKNYITEKNGLLLNYNIYYITCLYELNLIDEAEEFYEKNIVKLIKNNEKQALTIQLLEGERDFYLQNYTNSKQKLQSILSNSISLMSRLKILYKLALIDLNNGNKESAKVKLKEILELGNGLMVAQKAHQHLVLLNN